MPEVSISLENRRLTLLIACHVLLITLPYWWASSLVPNGFVWGGLLFNPDDQNVHLAWAKQAANGHFFARDLFTTENLHDGSQPLFVNLFTVLVGFLSRHTTLAPVTIYHTLRVVFAALGLKWLHELTQQWTDNPRVRLTTVALAAFAGGAGWLLDLAPQVLANRTFIDRPDGTFPMMPEAFGFASAFVFPLNTAAMALLCLCYARLLRARKTLANQETGVRRDVIIAATAAFFIANIHTYDALPLIVILFLATLLEPRPNEKTINLAQWKATLIVACAACLPVAYQVLVFAGSEEFRVKAQTPTPAPQLFEIALSYGALGILAIIGAYRLIRWRGDKTLWPVIWLYATLLMIYAPVSFARKMIEGVHLPLCFLASLALVNLLERFPRKYLRRAIWAGAVGVLSVSSLQFVGWCIGTNWRDNNLSRGPLMPPLYFAQSDMNALHFLNLNAQREPRKYLQAVLCLPKLGNYVPQTTGLNVYIGHWAETLHLGGHDGKLARAIAFYDGSMPDAEARVWLKENRIGTIVEGQYERALFGNSLPSSRLGLKPLWSEGDTAVYAAP